MPPLPRPTRPARSSRLDVTHDRFGYPLKPGEVLRYARRKPKGKSSLITPEQAAAMFDEQGRVKSKEEIERILRGKP